MDTTSNTTARYVTCSTLVITNRTTTLTVSITNNTRGAIATNTSGTLSGTLAISINDTTRGANTTRDRDSDNNDRLFHQPHHQLTRCLHRPHLHYRLYHPHHGTASGAITHSITNLTPTTSITSTPHHVNCTDHATHQQPTQTKPPNTH